MGAEVPLDISEETVLVEKCDLLPQSAGLIVIVASHHRHSGFHLVVAIFL